MESVDVPALSLQGWGLVRYGSPSSEFTPFWLMLQHGLLCWFVDESSHVPEKITSLNGGKYKATGDLLEKGEEVLEVSATDLDGPVTFCIAVASYESLLWQNALRLHVQVSSSIVEPAANVLKQSMTDHEDVMPPATLPVHIKGESYEVTVHMDDDVSAVANAFIEEHHLKPEFRTRIESELLKTMLDNAVAFQAKQRRHAAELRRKLTGIVVQEQRALAAERHADNLADNMGRMEQAMQRLVQKLEDMKDEYEQRLVEVRSRIDDKDRALYDLKKKLEVSNDEKADLEQSLRDVESSVEKTQLAAAENRARTAETKIKDLDAELSTWRTGDQQSTIVLRKELQQALKDLKESRRQKALKDKALQEAKRDTEKAMYDLRVMYGVQAGMKGRGSPSKSGLGGSGGGGDENSPGGYQSPEPSSKEMNDLRDALDGSESALEQALTEKRMLEARVQELGHDSAVAVGDRNAAQEEARRLRSELEKWQESSLASKLLAAGEENKSLREQIMKLNGEIGRLTGQLEEVRASAVEAVNMLQSLSPDGEVMEMLSKAMSRPVTNYYAPEFVSSEPPRPPLSSPSKSGVRLNSFGSPIPIGGKIPTASPMIAARSEWTLAKDFPFVEESIAMSSVQMRILYSVYEKYCNDFQTITHSRFIRFAKEFLLTPSQSGASVYGIAPHEAPMLVAGDIDLIFKAAIKTDPDDKKAPFGTGPRAFIRRSQTTAASNMIFHQFIQAISMLARKLYASVVEERYGTGLEFLPVVQREPAAKALVLVLLMNKVMPAASKIGVAPLPFFFIDRVVDHHLPTRGSFWKSMSDHVELMMSWFSAYADSQAPNALETDANVLMTFKALLRFGHSYGLIPYLVRETQMFGIFEEMLLWKKAHGDRLLAHLPPPVLHMAQLEVMDLEKAVYTLPQMKKDSRGPAPGFESASMPPTTTDLQIIPHKDRLGPATFALLIVTIALQGFPDVSPEDRVEKFFQWVRMSTGDDHY